MTKITWLLRIVGVIQLLLGILYLFAPPYLLSSMGHSAVAPDINYPFAMLASRFIAFGLAFLYIATNPVQHKLWMLVMVIIQIIDLLAGIFYTATGVVSLELSAFAMFNATWISILLLLALQKVNKN
jgi:hypothetical protein